ncbi:MAG: FG-GAP-like repeat-containing protein, partial [Paludibacter sp.]
WGKRTTTGGAITAISGTNSSTFTPTSTNLGGAGTYYVVCTSTPTYGSATVSNEVTVTVNALPAISGQSTALQNVCLNGTAAAMTVTATGANITYQWYSNTTASNTGGTTLGTATGAQTSSYTPLTTTAGTKYYYCIVSGTCTPAVTSAVSGAITVIAVPTISSFTPTSGTVGTTVTITGTNFNTTAGNNSVYFGATKASVSAATATSLTVTVPTGASFEKISVTNLSNNLNAYSSKPFITTFSGASTLAAGSFATKVDLTTGSSPYDVVSGDFDGDGKADVVVTNMSSANISIYRNTSTSGNVSFATKADVATGSSPFRAAVGDIDGDGKLDLVVPNYISNTVSVYLNTSTSGAISFATKVDITSLSGPVAVAIGNLDGDGKPDLAIVCTLNNTISLIRNLSTVGVLSFSAKTILTSNTAPYHICMGDIDGDGLADLAVANNMSTSPVISVFRNTNTVADVLSFATKVDFTSTTGLQSIVIGDLDGDNKPDIGAGGNAATLFRNTSTSGTISFAAKSDIAATPSPYNITFSDINGDGKLDVLTSNLSNKVSALINTCTSGNLSFSSEVQYTAGQSGRSIHVCDIDGDGRPDVTVANSGSDSFSVLRNTIIPAPTISSFTPTSGAIGTTVTITGTNFNTTTSNNIVYFGATKASVSAATATSLTVTVPTGATFEKITVTNLFNNLTAYSSKPFITTFSGASTIAAGSFATKVDVATGGSPYDIITGDFDGDRKVDVATVAMADGNICIYRNTSTSGTVSFATRADIATGSNPYHLAVGDFDGDGKLDLAVTNFNASTISVLRNTSSSGSISFAAKVDLATAANPISLTVGDFDADGKPDIAIVNFSPALVSIFRNLSSSGSISFDTKIDLTAVTTPYHITSGDVDGDGLTDLVYANSSGSVISTYRNTNTTRGVMSFAAKADFATNAQSRRVAIGDLDNDGKPDIVVSGSSATVMRNTSTSGAISLAAKSDVTSGASPLKVAVTDMNGDGKLDIVTVSETGSYASVLLNTCSSGTISFNTNVDYTVGNTGRAAAVADIDGDGKPDIAVANSSSNSFSVLRNTITPTPTISSFTPTIAGSGTTITITGTNFTGATAVSFGGTAATSFSVVSATSITAVVAAGTSGSVSVTTPGGTATLAGFSFANVPVLNATTSATTITATSAVSGGNITSDGGASVTARGVCWSISQNPTVSDSKTTNGTGTGVFTSNLSGLTSGTVYYVRAYATNTAGTGYGTQVSFTYSALDINTSSFSNPSVVDVVVTNGTTLNCNGSDNSFHSITVQPGGKLTLNDTKTLNAGSLVLESSASGTATFIDGNTGETPPAVTATVKQYLTSGRNWYIATPLSNATTSAFSTAGSILYYNEPTAEWLEPVTGSTLNPLRGYISALTSTTGAISFTGTLNSGAKSITLTRTAGKDKEGFNLVGNPYPSYVSWDDATKTNLENTIWYRTQNGLTAYVFDTYGSISGIGTNNNGTAAVTGTIPPMQSFWVRVVPGQATGLLAFTNAMRSHGESGNRLKAPSAVNVSQSVLRLQVSNGTNADETILLFNANASNLYDIYDSPKMSNANIAIPELFTMAGSERVAINGMSELSSSLIIPLGFTNLKNGTNTFTIKCSYYSNISEGTRLFLRDNTTGIITDLTTNASYSFTSDAYNDTKRFEIVASRIVSSSIKLNGTLEKLLVYTSGNALLHVETLKAGNRIETCKITDMQGKVLLINAINRPKCDLSIQLPVGMYLVVTKTNEGKYTNKIGIK